MQRRPEVVAAHSLDHVEFEVPDLDEAERFYGAFGLDVVKVAEALHLHAAGDRRPWVFVHEGRGAKKRLRHLSFGIFEDDLPRFRARAASLGVATMEPLAPRAGGASL